MLNYYNSENKNIVKIDKYQPECWVSCIEPTEQDLDLLVEKFDIDADFLRSAIDEEESSHIESDDGKTFLTISIPTVKKVENNITYDTVPLGIVITKENVITICLEDNPLLSEFAEGVIKYVDTSFKTQFVLKIILRVATKYLQYLKQINKISDHVEGELRKSMKNKELIQLLEIEKSLVYFSSALKSNEVTLEKVTRGRYLKMYEEDKDLLEDVLIEIKQAIDMSNIYLNILSGTMDAFASVISNNLNIVMKILASITLIISVPTVITGFYGMNVTGGIIPGNSTWYFPVLVSLALMLVATLVLHKFKML